MSNIYILEPPTNGKILLKTTVGDIDIELWSKEAPLACKNFVQLCLDGYYDNTIFHRVVKHFIAQGGDPTGTGTGGESIYGQPFKDEIHSRLRFNRRGLVAMANAGKNDNGSQFFFTLAETPELQKKHTIFGKVAGKTIYNMIKLEEGEIDEEERPAYPNKILSTEVLSNPFPEIVPRSLPKKKVSDIKAPKKKVPQAVKNFKLLSFGEEAEDDEGEIKEINQKYHGKKKHIPDLQEVEESESTNEEIDIDETKLESEDEQYCKSSPEQISLVEKIRGKLNPNKKCPSEDFDTKENTKSLKWDKDEVEPPKKKSNLLIDEYMKEKNKYGDMKKSLPNKGDSREKQTLERLLKFREKIRNQQSNTNQDENTVGDDKDSSWLTHSLKCDDKVVLAKDANVKSDDWFEITDPRNMLNKRRRENSSNINKSRIKSELN